MAFELNKIHHSDWMNNGLPDKSVQLLIADPPYFEVKGDFDFIWKTFDEYLQQVELWAKECSRLLADNGTLFWYGDRKNIAYSQVILDKYFNFENHIYWQKAEKCQMEMFDTLRSFYCRGYERILMYSRGEDEKMWELLYHDTMRKATNEVQDYLNAIITRDELMIILLDNGNCKNIESAKQNANNILSQRSHKPQMITEKQYNWIDKEKIAYSELRKIFETAYEKYNIERMKQEEKRRTFNNFKKLSDHWFFTQGNAGEFEHQTVKPEEMTRVMILTCSKENDLVFIPFAGSGTECAMCSKENRRFIGFDIEEKYVTMANNRNEMITMQPNLFHCDYIPCNDINCDCPDCKTRN
jgi:site-specific DNA-methyltransferase (adenine-specific)